MDFRKILVALDPAGEDQTTIFERALALATTVESRMMLFGCLMPTTSADAEQRVGALAELGSSSSLNARQHGQETERARSRAWLESLAQEARQLGRKVEVVAEVGSAGQEICRLAEHWKADVIVLGLTRRGGFADRILGSVTHHLVHHAPCSVLMVRGG